MKTYLLIIALVAATLLSGCGNKQNLNTNAEMKTKITFTTSKEVGEKIILSINADEADQSEIWIDLNNNGVKDKGEAVTEFGEEAFVETEFKLGAQTVTLYGNVTYLTCVDNDITTLDVSGNPLLTELNCISNEITSLDLSKNTALKVLACRSNEISSLDLSNNKELEEALCGCEELTSLTLSNPVLELLDANFSSLTSLDLSACPELQEVRILENDFTEEAIENMFGTLPDRTGKSWEGKAKINGNPGTETVDTSIAESKNWVVDKEF
ncbi:MAG: hypothetical protein PHP31_05150 [Lentimicrobiaceae bacterium]|nr:hypothetical protein [Lentimicrobiaceae bacterium]